MPDLASLHPRLSRLIPRLASDSEGEVIATVRAIRNVLGKAGLDLHDLAAGLPIPPPEPDDWEAALRFVAQEMDALNDSEARFIRNLRLFASAGTGWAPTSRQAQWLEAIRADLAREVPDA